MKLIHNFADLLDHRDIPTLVLAADVIFFTETPSGRNEVKRVDVILHIEPVAHIAAVAVNWERLSFERVQNDERDQFFRKLEGAVIVGAVRHNDRKAIGAEPREGEMIACGLRCRIGRRGVVGSGFGEEAVAASERTVNFIGGNLKKPKPFFLVVAQVGKICARRLEQCKGPVDVRLQ